MQKPRPDGPQTTGLRGVTPNGARSAVTFDDHGPLSGIEGTFKPSADAETYRATGP